MKNIYLTANKLQKFKGDNKKLPNMREDFIFGRSCICIGQTEHIRWWTSEKNYLDYNKEKNEGNNNGSIN